MNKESVLWELKSLEQIGDHKTEVIGSPVVMDALDGQAISFDGRKDAILLNTNPLYGARAFTIEVLFRPDGNGLKEQRFLHFQEEEDKRVLIEIRLEKGDLWFLDTYIKSDRSSCTLCSKDALHSVGQWYHAALVYKEGEMSHFVNGFREANGRVDFSPLGSGLTSIGSRLNRVSWFKGAIKRIQVTHQALTPKSFLSLTHI